jgi:hypothetical protein
VERQAIAVEQRIGWDIGEEGGVIGLGLFPGSNRGGEGGITGRGEVFEEGWWSGQKLGINLGELLECGDVA